MHSLSNNNKSYPHVEAPGFKSCHLQIKWAEMHKKIHRLSYCHDEYTSKFINLL